MWTESENFIVSIVVFSLSQTKSKTARIYIRHHCIMGSQFVDHKRKSTKIIDHCLILIFTTRCSINLKKHKVGWITANNVISSYKKYGFILWMQKNTCRRVAYKCILFFFTKNTKSKLLRHIRTFIL